MKNTFFCILFFLLVVCLSNFSIFAQENEWVAWNSGNSSSYLVGGTEGTRKLYVCRVSHSGGVHPGKVVDGKCNIGWGGKEHALSPFEVLVDNGNYSWVDSEGAVPTGAVAGGQENGKDLYVCRTKHPDGSNDYHPGKVVDGKCNIGWGGQEHAKSVYQLLVKTTSYTLTYNSNPMEGSISGTSPQTVNHGANGSQVEAVPKAGYHFVGWDDGNGNKTRTDENVIRDITVKAIFEKDVPIQ